MGILTYQIYARTLQCCYMELVYICARQLLEIVHHPMLRKLAASSTTPILTNGRDGLDPNEDGSRQGRPPQTHRPRTGAVDTSLSDRDGDEVVQQNGSEERGGIQRAQREEDIGESLDEGGRGCTVSLNGVDSDTVPNRRAMELTSATPPLSMRSSTPIPANVLATM